ncbi:MAG TPA: hypothetical protein VNY73_02545 [Bacteroidia bacterium]|jgi:hypothetical protein|nr:hypothetical protein [Bacteroidia bacterium]
MNFQPENIKFPQYRRYKNGLSYFKILSLTEFEEIQVIGTKRILNRVTAGQYPEKVFVHDMLFKYVDFAVEIKKEEYDALLP